MVELDLNVLNCDMHVKFSGMSRNRNYWVGDIVLENISIRLISILSRFGNIFSGEEQQRRNTKKNNIQAHTHTLQIMSTTRIGQTDLLQTQT